MPLRAGRKVARRTLMVDHETMSKQHHHKHEHQKKPVARTPEETQILFGELFVRGDIDSLLKLYERDAALVVAPGVVAPGVVVHGRKAIRQALIDQRALFIGTPTFSIQQRVTIRTDDIAKLISDVTLSGIGQNNQPIAFNFRISDIVRRHGRKWLIVIDNPFGAAAAPPD